MFTYLLTDKDRDRERERKRPTETGETDNKHVTWCFTPTQPVRLYQGDTERQTDKKRQRDRDRQRRTDRQRQTERQTKPRYKRELRLRDRQMVSAASLTSLL